MCVDVGGVCGVCGVCGVLRTLSPTPTIQNQDHITGFKIQLIHRIEHTHQTTTVST